MRDRAIYTTNQEPGAILNGTRIEKVNSAADDTRRDGSQGKVRGSVRARSGYAYFAEWDDMPGVPVGIAGYRIRAVVADQ